MYCGMSSASSARRVEHELPQEAVQVAQVLRPFGHLQQLQRLGPVGPPSESGKPMKSEYDMTGARRATEIEHLNRLRAGKSRVTLMLDDDVLQAYREAAGARGTDYQALIDDALREHLHQSPIDEATLRRVLREELRATG
jgi:uncharacterized protein (DUF4415 family)